MNAKTEIYWVRFNKARLANGDIAVSDYVLGVDVIMGVQPTSIKVIKDRVYVTFSDGGKHIFGYNSDVELFYRPVKKEEPKKE
jgi:hypothetical protein